MIVKYIACFPSLMNLHVGFPTYFCWPVGLHITCNIAVILALLYTSTLLGIYGYLLREIGKMKVQGMSRVLISGHHTLYNTVIYASNVRPVTQLFDQSDSSAGNNVLRWCGKVRTILYFGSTSTVANMLVCSLQGSCMVFQFCVFVHCFVYKLCIFVFCVQKYVPLLEHAVDFSYPENIR